MERKKTEFEFEAKQTKEALERYKASIEPMKVREQQLVTELNAAKAKVEELESRLDLLERAIEADRQKLEVDKTRSESALSKMGRRNQKGSSLKEVRTVAGN